MGENANQQQRQGETQGRREKTGGVQGDPPSASSLHVSASTLSRERLLAV